MMIMLLPIDDGAAADVLLYDMMNNDKPRVSERLQRKRNLRAPIKNMVRFITINSPDFNSSWLVQLNQ